MTNNRMTTYDFSKNFTLCQELRGQDLNIKSIDLKDLAEKFSNPVTSPHFIGIPLYQQAFAHLMSTLSEQC